MTTKTKLFSALAIMMMALVLMPFAGSQPAYAEDGARVAFKVSDSDAGTITVTGQLAGSSIQSTFTVSYSQERFFEPGTAIELTVNPNDGYEFSGWSVFSNSAEPHGGWLTTITEGSKYSLSLPYDSHLTLQVIANFKVSGPYNITATRDPAYAGAIQVLKGPFERGEMIALKVTKVNPGYTFAGWVENGTVVCEGATYSFAVTRNRNLIAQFDAGPGPYSITATAYPADAGIVQVPVGPFDKGTTVELKVTTTFPGYEFVGWMEDGEIYSTQTTYSFPANGNRSLTARFRSTTPHAVEISATENGSVTPNSASAKELDNVTLNVSPADGFELDTLTVKDEGGNTIPVTADVNGSPTFSMPAGKAVVSATFKEIPVVVTVPVSMRFSVYSGNQWIDAEEAGAISSATINGENTRSLNVTSGETVAIHIKLAAGYMVSAVRVGNDYAWSVLDDYSYSSNPANGTYDISFTATAGKESALVISLNEAVKVTYDMNGGTAGEGWRGDVELVSKRSQGTLAHLSSMVVPPAGQELDYVAITDANGTRSVSAQKLAASGHIYNSDVTFKFMWKNIGEQGTFDQISIDGAKVVLSATAFTYSGKVAKPDVKTVGGKALVMGTDYTLSFKNAKGAAVASPKAAGTYTVVVTGKGAYTGMAKATYTIKKAPNALRAKAKTKKAVGVKAGKRLKAGKLFVVSGANGALAYQKAKGSKKIKVAANGSVKVKKGCKEGTYKLKVKVQAAGDANHLASAVKTVTVKVKVK